jgi:hypothetical protein
MRAATAILLLSLAAPSQAREKLVRVPVVGCASGGQTGLQPAPNVIKPHWVKGKFAAQLAYYSPGDFGVFAPRRWHCAAVYGSSGAGLIVVPSARTAESFRRLSHTPVRGPFVLAGTSFAGTSGRGTVMDAIARYFPSHQDFIQKNRELEMVVERLPRGPYRSDIIRRRTPEYVRFTTPAWKKGEGSNSLIPPDGTAIEGFRKLVGPRNEPDLWGVDVRLPPNQTDLTEAILANSR